MKFYLIAAILGLVFPPRRCLCQALKYDSLQKLILGEWQCNQDSGNYIIFSKGHIKEFNKGERGVDIYRYTIETSPCDSILISTKGTGFFLVEIGNDKLTYCYAITDISDDYLELVYAGGRLWSYRKVRHMRHY